MGRLRICSPTLSSSSLWRAPFQRSALRSLKRLRRTFQVEMTSWTLCKLIWGPHACVCIESRVLQLQPCHGKSWCTYFAGLCRANWTCGPWSSCLWSAGGSIFLLGEWLVCSQVVSAQQVQKYSSFCIIYFLHLPQGPWDLAFCLLKSLGTKLHQSSALQVLEGNVPAEATCPVWW